MFEELIGIRIPVLDKGFVQVIDVMGGDNAVVDAARKSFEKTTKKIHGSRGLIRYLMRHFHSTPFEMCELKLGVRVPMDCWRQWTRHRSAKFSSIDEYSTRYSKAINDKQETKHGEWRSQSKDRKQGSGANLELSTGAFLTGREKQFHEMAELIYAEREHFNVALEQARKDLPLSTYTEAYWKIDLHNLLHFLELRMDSHAQQEIREYATVIGEQIVAKWCPIVWEAFCDYRLNSIMLSAQEQELLCRLAFYRYDDQMSGCLASTFEDLWEGFLKLTEIKENMEMKEFKEKARKIFRIDEEEDSC